MQPAVAGSVEAKLAGGMLRLMKRFNLPGISVQRDA